jgi:hypothetical protein
MSAISEKVRQALFTKMNVGSVVGSGKASGVHWKQAPESASYPFIVFDRAPLNVEWSMGNTQQGERDRWFVKCLADEDSSATKEPSELCEDILELAETAIGNSLVITGQTVSRVQRVADIPPILTQLNDRPIFQHGFQLETFVS